MDYSGSVVSRPQKLLALDRANRVRSVRAEVKRRIAGGEITAAEVILSARWELQRMPVAEVLVSQPFWGATKCRRFLIRLTMPEAKTIGSMTARQRTVVAANLALPPSRVHAAIAETVPPPP
jgi:hypothetical protein